MNTNPLILNNGLPATLPFSGSSSFVGYASSQVTTQSGITGSSSFVTFDNSPAFTFTPTITGTYKVYCPIPIQEGGAGQAAAGRIFNTTGGATLLQESQASVNGAGTETIASIYVQSVYTLTAGVSYVFDIQGVALLGSTISNRGDLSPFYMFAEGIGLSAPANAVSYAQAYFGNSSNWTTTSTSFTDPTNSGGNALTVRQSSNIVLTAAASNVCGITFTPANAQSVYLITAKSALYNFTGAETTSIQMTDGTTIIDSCASFNQQATTAAVIITVPVGGIYVPGTASPVTVKLQLAVNGGTGAIQTSGSMGQAVVEWTVVELNSINTQVNGLQLQQATYTLTSSQLMNSPSTPVVVLPTVSGKVIQLQSVDWQYNYGTTPYVLGTGSSGLFVSYTSDVGTYQYTNSVIGSDTGFLDQSSDQELILPASSAQGYLRNQGLSFSTQETSITGGDGTLTLIMYYFILS